MIGSTLSTPAKVTLGLLAALVTTGALILLFGSDDDSPSAPEPQLLSVAELTEFARVADGPIYWAGPRGDAGLEVTTSADGTTFVRYLEPGVDAGDPAAEFLTVATYPVADAEVNLKAATDRPGAIIYQGRGGVRAVSNRDNPTSVYLSPDSGIQVEVYDPSAERAAEIVRSGALRPVS